MNTMLPEIPATDTAQALFAEVVFDRPLDHAYTYAVPTELQANISVGQRVECSFGRGTGNTIGYVVRLTNVAPVREVKSISKVLDDVALLDDPLLTLTRWMADYYVCGWGQVLHAVVPAGVRDKAGTKNVRYVIACPKEELPNPLPTVTPKQKQVLEAVKQEKEPIELTELAKKGNVGVGIISGLISKGLLKSFTERVEKSTLENRAETPAEPAPEIVLNADQEKVWAPIREAVAQGGFHPFLLHGVTGSGKTEIYLRAIEEVVKQGKEAIILVPEISLTPQTMTRFQGRFGKVAVLHSHLTDVERAAYWRRVAAGHVQVVVGARSAVFAPTRKLGLIVIDEEHENSFKQEATPRYHARDVAIMRARLANIPILLGSATPSLESWHHAKTAEFNLLTMPNRVEDRALPQVRIVDLRHEPKGSGAVGPSLETEMKSALKAGGQVILLLNRRGFSTHVHCPECGHVVQCAHCDLALTFHRDKAALMCHSCGTKAAPLLQCPQCAKQTIRYQGIGTEKLQNELEMKFPDRVIQRMDSDTMAKPGSHQRVLDAFREGLIHILLGTQMIAKGLDFPNVTLVGVINADVGLHLPDFRAAERTFQLLAQVAGRAGRGEKGGRVLIQTYTPDHPSIKLAANHDYLAFASQELGFRKEHLYPPYQKLARVIVRSENQDAADKFAETMAGAFKQAVARLQKKRGSTTAPVRVLGPAECPVFKLHDYFRFHFQLQAESSGDLHEVLREVLAVAKPPHGVEFQADVDPYNMM